MQTSLKYKHIEIGEIPEDWAVLSFDSLTKNYDAQRIPLSKMERQHRRGEYPYYGASGIIDYIDDYTYDGKFLLISEDGENLRSRKQPINFIVEGKFWVNNHAHIVKANDKSILEFIHYWFLSNSIRSYLSGSVQPKLSQENLNSIQIACPQPKEQQQIAHVLLSLDDKIELNRKSNMILEAIGKALFKHYFKYDRKLTSNTVDLQDIIEINPSEKLTKGMRAKYLEMKNLPERGMWTLSRETKVFKGGSKFRNGDTLVARITPCLENGKTAFVSFLNSDEVAFGSTEFIVLRPKNKLYEEYIYIFSCQGY